MGSIQQQKAPLIATFSYIEGEENYDDAIFQ
jgi:hypothetical protein